MNIRAVVFDLVNVLMRYSWEDWADHNYGEKIREQLQYVFWQSGYWDELDRGTWDTDAFIVRCVEKAPELEYWIKDSLRHFGDGIELYEYAIRWIQELKKKGYSVYYLSNYPRILQVNHPEVLEFIPHTDGGIFSCDVNMIKPEVEIYAELCARYGLEPSECLFIDDTYKNVEAAKAFGMKALQFHGYDRSYSMIMNQLKE